jgi:hypothetical protein
MSLRAKTGSGCAIWLHEAGPGALKKRNFQQAFIIVKHGGTTMFTVGLDNNSVNKIGNEKAISIQTLMILFGMFVCLYLYELTNFVPSVDMELELFGLIQNWGTGRWGYAIIKSIFLPSLTIFFNVFMFGVLGSIGYYIMLRTLNVGKFELHHYLIFPVFIAHPLWILRLDFPALAICDAFAILFVCIAAYLSTPVLCGHKSCRYKQVSLLILLTLAISIYQTFIFSYLVICICVIILQYKVKSVSVKELLYRAVYVCSVCCLALMLSFLVGIISVRLSDQA